MDGIILSDLALKFKGQGKPHTKLVIHVKSSETNGPNFWFGTQKFIPSFGFILASNFQPYFSPMENLPSNFGLRHMSFNGRRIVGVKGP